MKKILVLMLVLALATPFMFSWHDLTNTAGIGNYSIDLKLHNPANNAYRQLEMEVGLPLTDKFKMYFWIKDLGFEAQFNQDPLVTAGTAISSQYWSEIRGFLRMFLGINLTDTFAMNILLGVGADNATMNPQFWGGSASSTGTCIYKEVVYNNGKVTTKSGDTSLQFGIGLILKSGMFNNAIGNLTIQQYVDLRFGYGKGYMSGSIPILGTYYGNDVTDTTPGGDANRIKSENFVFGYDLDLGTSIPIAIGLPKFSIDPSIQVQLNYKSMTGLLRGTSTTDFDTNPSQLGFSALAKINFGINPKDNISSNTWIRGRFFFDSISYAPRGVAAQSVLLPGFEVRFGQNVQITFAKICWVKFENEWRFTSSMSSFTTNPDGSIGLVQGSETAKTKTNGGNWTNSVTDNPDMAIGFNFDGWGFSAAWKPSVAIMGANDFGNGFGQNDPSYTNLFNLQNWEIMMSVSFPPPKK